MYLGTVFMDTDNKKILVIAWVLFGCGEQGYHRMFNDA